jgi:hypothetical protein
MSVGAPSGNNNVDYAAIVNGTITPTFTSAKNWLIRPYSTVLASPKNYQELYDKLGVDSCAYSPASGTVPDAQGRFLISGDLATSGGQTAVGNCGSGSTARVVFINGNLTINGNLSYTRPTVFIVKNNITIAPSVTTINAVLLSDGSVFTGTTYPGTPDVQLTVNGGIMGVLSSTGQVDLQRNLVSNNVTQASEKFIYEPKYLFLLSSYLGNSTTYYEEEKP